ncbi:MAG: hypothetical protein HOV81_18885 [Kofleriaceae bacterium]|nr:hypothetical protein [Kofleriaceae bacterium]
MACGGDDGPGKVTPDASVPPMEDSNTGPMCTETAIAPTQTLADSNEDAILWSGPVTTNLGATGDTLVQFEFYSGLDNLTAPIDLAAGNQANYQTCAACIRVLAINAAGNMIEKQYFQSGGTLTLTEDPFTHQRMVGSVTNLSLVEVTVDDMYKSTPVPGGVCLSLGNLTLNADAVPAEWTCPKADYADGATCNCACGAHDPDCDVANAPVAGCTGAQVCGDEDTCIDVCNVLSTPPVGCPAGTCGFYSSTQDICYTDATAVDAAALGGTCTSTTALFCGVTNTVATGICDVFEGDDLGCRKACDDAADCAAGQLCSAIVGTKGLCITPPANDTCETAATLTIGTPVTGNTGGSTSNYNTGLETTACTGVSQKGGDVAYQVTLAANQAITVKLTNVSPNFDPSVALLGPGTAAAVCNANPVACLKGADAGLDGANETFTFTATTAGTYFVIVDTFYQTQGGKFTLTVTSP